MAFPQVQATTTYFSGGDGIDPIPLPATVLSGELLLMWFMGEAGGYTPPTGWSELANLTNGAVMEAGLFAKVAAGTEGGTSVNVGGTPDDYYFAITHRINQWKGSLDGVHVATATGDSSSPNPPSVNAGAVREHLWFGFVGLFDFPNNYVAPTNYTNLVEDPESTIASARRELEIQSEDPGPYGSDISDLWIAATVAVEPVVAAAATLDLEGYRGRNDDGDEDAATWITTQDTAFEVDAEGNWRIRLLVNATEDPASGQFTARYKLASDADSEIEEI